MSLYKWQDTRNLKIYNLEKAHRIKKGQKFLLNGDKLKITVMFRGREMGRMEDGVKILDEVIDGLSEISKIDKKPSTEGRRISVVLSPI